MDPHQPIEFKHTYVDRQDPAQVQFDYDRQLDTLFIDLDAPPGPRSTYYLDDGVNIVFDPSTNEIVGFRVEDWQIVFLQRHKDLRRSWRWYRILCQVDDFCAWLPFPTRDREQVVKRVEGYIYRTSPSTA